jgi:hypothetical protein
MVDENVPAVAELRMTVGPRKRPRLGGFADPLHPRSIVNSCEARVASTTLDTKATGIGREALSLAVQLN